MEQLFFLPTFWNQVQQELSSTFARLCHLVDESTAEMKEEAKSLEREVRQLEEIAGRSKVAKFSLTCVHNCIVQVLRNQATFLNNKLEMFANTYLGLE